MSVRVPGNWFVYLFASDQRVGSIDANNSGEVPLTEFTGVVSGVPTTPAWLKIEIYGMYPTDIGDRSLTRRAGGVHTAQGAGQWGGTMTMLEYDFNENFDEYADMLKRLRNPYTYIWFNDYDAAAQFMTNRVDNAMRIAFDSFPKPNREDAYIDVTADWRKYREGL